MKLFFQSLVIFAFASHAYAADQLLYVDWKNGPVVQKTDLQGPPSISEGMDGALPTAGQIRIAPNKHDFLYVTWRESAWELHLAEWQPASRNYQQRILSGLEGGKAGGPGQPAWSHDGKRVAFVSFSGRNQIWDIVVLDLATMEKRVVASKFVPFQPDIYLSKILQPQWGPDNQSLIINCFGRGETYGGHGFLTQVNVNTNVETVLVENLDGWLYGGIWSASDLIYFVQWSEALHGWKLSELNLKTQNAKDIYTLKAGGMEAQLSLSPSGRDLAFVDFENDGVLKVLDLDSGAIVYTANLDAGVTAGHPAWSVTGSFLSFQRFNKGQSELAVVEFPKGTLNHLLPLGAGNVAGCSQWVDQ